MNYQSISARHLYSLEFTCRNRNSGPESIPVVVSPGRIPVRAYILTDDFQKIDIPIREEKGTYKIYQSDLPEGYNLCHTKIYVEARDR